MIGRYVELCRQRGRWNALLFAGCSLLWGFWAVFLPEAVRLGLLNPDVYEYYFHESFALVAVCAAAFALLAAGLAFLIRSIAASGLLLSLVSLAAGLANTNKVEYRGAPVLPSDIFLLKDAMVAAGDYGVVVSKSFYLLLTASAALFLLMLPVKTPRLPGKGRVIRVLGSAAAGAAGILCAAAIVVSVFWSDAALTFLGYDFFPKVMWMECRNNTFYPTFFRSMPVLFTPVPEGYGPESMQSVAGQLQALAADANQGQAVDILIVQLESFYLPDLYDLSYDRQEVFGELFALADGSGYLVSPQTGGGTADVEFEVLTGITSNDSQCLVNPFSIYLYEGFPSIVGYLNSRGYATASIHSHHGGLYNRPAAYRALGFQESYFADNFQNPVYFGNYISEQSCIDKVMEVYDSLATGENGVFLHTVTMQNHIGYALDLYPEDQLVACSSDTLTGDDLLLARIYLTSCRDICHQVARLAQHLAESGRDAVLIVYGDHQSPIATPVEGQDELYAVPEAAEVSVLGDEEHLLLSHRTPLVVFSTKEEQESFQLGAITPNALLPKVLAELDVTRPAYFDYLLGLPRSFDSSTADYAIFADGSVQIGLAGKLERELLPRRLLQHDILHGKHYLTDSLY